MDTELLKFKQLLEYFVAHLEYIQSNVTDSKGYKQYIEPLIQNNSFKISGQGYAGATIQDQIAKWQDYNIGKICINVMGNFGKYYYTKKCYLNWDSTGMNIYALWNSKKTKIISLGLTEYQYQNDPPSYMDSETTFKISSLELYNEQEPNEIINTLFSQYKENLINKMTYNMIEIYLKKLLANKNIILHGAPGTGKTNLAMNIASIMAIQKAYNVKFTNEEEKLYSTHTGFVQFHPSYDYTDFVEGLRPNDNGNGSIGFKLKNGIFKEFCKRALASYKKEINEGKNDKEITPYIFIIDEINRGDISKIFGELFFSIDPGYRGIKGKVKTQYANLEEGETTFDKELENGYFYIPENIYIIGTMNDIDRSVESMDFAMRRRFTFLEITAKQSAENMNLNEKQKSYMDRLNNAIYNERKLESSVDLTSSYHIGASYFLNITDFKELWEYKLEPLLAEYLRGMDEADDKLNKLKKAYNNECN